MAPATRLSSHRVAWLLTQPDERLADTDRKVVAREGAESPVLARTRTVAMEFVRVLREHAVRAFDTWQHGAATSPLVRFARAVDRDATEERNAVALSRATAPPRGT